jgi:hypothetical protein
VLGAALEKSASLWAIVKVGCAGLIAAGMHFFGRRGKRKLYRKMPAPAPPEKKSKNKKKKNKKNDQQPPPSEKKKQQLGQKQKKESKYPHGKYENEPYHHKNSNGRKSRCPKNGQQALDNSIPFKGEGKRRVSMEDDEFVVLHPHRTEIGLFHGYRCGWEKLSPEAQETLRLARWVNHKGKILLRMGS